MSVTSDMWSPDWQQRIASRLHGIGCDSVARFLERYPGEPYEAAAERLGDDVAAMQLSRLHIAEVRDEHMFRRVAMDSLARELNANLPRGWNRCADLPPAEPEHSPWIHLAALPLVSTEEHRRQRIEFQKSGAYAFWAVLLQEYDPNVESRADAVWKSLLTLTPPEGWYPLGPDDSLIVCAFEEGWPEKTRHMLRRQDFGLLCPNCSAVLTTPEQSVSEFNCYNCGEEIMLV